MKGKTAILRVKIENGISLRQTARDEIILDLDVTWAGESNIQVWILTCQLCKKLLHSLHSDSFTLTSLHISKSLYKNITSSRNQTFGCHAHKLCHKGQPGSVYGPPINWSHIQLVSQFRTIWRIVPGWNGNTNRFLCQVSLRGMQASVMDFYLHGNLRIVLKPLLQRLPLVGGMQVGRDQQSHRPWIWIKWLVTLSFCETLSWIFSSLLLLLSVVLPAKPNPRLRSRRLGQRGWPAWDQ